MDVAFHDYIDKFVVVYQGELITYSKKAEDHCKHLKKKFIKALEYGVALNPKKCIFWVIEGVLLGHIVSKDSVKIDTERVASIDEVPKLKNVKGIQSFFGQVNFLRRFVTNFVDISRQI